MLYLFKNFFYGLFKAQNRDPQTARAKTPLNVVYKLDLRLFK